MNVKHYNEFIVESIGANTMNRKPVEQLNNPKHNIQQPKTIATGKAGSIPMHWNNSPGVYAGARYGSNPSSKKRAMSYDEFILTHKKHTTK
jgi:hypothetical protein